MTDTPRRFVVPACVGAVIPDPDRGRDLPQAGDDVPWTPHWAGLVARGDVLLVEPKAEAPADPKPDPKPPAPPPKPADPPPALPKA